MDSKRNKRDKGSSGRFIKLLWTVAIILNFSQCLYKALRHSCKNKDFKRIKGTKLFCEILLYLQAFMIRLRVVRTCAFDVSRQQSRLSSFLIRKNARVIPAEEKYFHLESRRSIYILITCIIL